MPNPQEISISTCTVPDEVVYGTDLAALALKHLDIQDHDVVVVTQKVVSKAEGRVVSYDPEDPASLRTVIRGESRRVLRERDQLMIVETHHGFICANAGVDHSNNKPGLLTLLPLNPDRSAHTIATRIAEQAHVAVGVVITDTFGRVWRNGATDVALGICGVKGLLDLRGQPDQFGTPLSSSQICVADEMAAAANLVIGKSTRTPFALIRGLSDVFFGNERVSETILRSSQFDLFR